MTTRRGRGEGGITKRSDGRWMAQADLGWRDGRRRRKTILRTDEAGGSGQAPGDPATVRAWSAATPRKGDRARLSGPLAPSQEGPATVQDLHELRAGGPPAPAPGSRSRAPRQALASRRGDVVPRPRGRGGRPALDPVRPHRAAGGVESGSSLGTWSPRKRRCAHRPATASAAGDPSLSHPSRQRRSSGPSSAHRLEALITVALGLGLRRGEALALRWDAVDLEAGVLSVRHTLDWKGGDPVARRSLADERDRLLGQLNATTDGATRRELQASLAETRQKLKAVRGSAQFSEPKTARSRRRPSRSRTSSPPRCASTGHASSRSGWSQGHAGRESGLVFTTPIGTTIDTHSLHRTFKMILPRVLVLPNIRYHDLRHTAATLLLAQGVDPAHHHGDSGPYPRSGSRSIPTRTWCLLFSARQPRKMHEILTR